VVVKTTSGSQSGITHAGGRYVHPNNCYRNEVVRQMRELGREPPQLPFVVAPGEYTLYHEWGHHLDRTWSGDNEEILFSFRWLSRFYKLCVRPSRIARNDHGFQVEYGEPRPIESDVDGSGAVVAWWQMSSELFADLFEDWMREDKRIAWDHCEPESIHRAVHGYPSVRVALLPGVRAEDVRAETYSLFTPGIRSAAELPPVREGLFGPNSDAFVAHLRDVLGRMRAEAL
jgi:hypothetical protein